MKQKVIDMTGTTVGEWVVLRRAGNTANGSAKWLCRCSCGAEKDVIALSLRQGTSTKCRSCSRREVMTGRQIALKHGMSRSSTYGSWRAMKSRCYLSTNKDYANYGGRGITVCDRWKDSFEAFLADMGERPDGMTLDRPNNNGIYEPSNCRWADEQTQKRNRRTSKLVPWQVEWIRSLWFDFNASQKSIAIAFGIDRSHVSKICSNTAWSQS